MSNGYVVDSGVLIGLARHRWTTAREQIDQIKRRGARLITIREVLAECRTVPLTLVQELRLFVEPTRVPVGSTAQLKALHAFQAGGIKPRADRCIVGHAIAKGMDILTTDNAMNLSSYREFFQRLNRMRDTDLPAWRLPHIEVVRAYPHS